MKVFEAVEPRADIAPSQDRAWSVWLPRTLLLVVLILTAVWTVRRTTWYLAIDQFGYLTFAADLAQGRVLHEWDLLPALGKFLPKNAEVDVYAQTYVRRGDRLFCRYAPGFPLVLALVRVTLGPSAEHFVNPAVLLLLLVCLYVIGRRTLRSEWLGLAAALLGALLPNYVVLWSTSPLRDVPAHLFALSGLALLLPRGSTTSRGRREAVAGFLLGFAVSTRIDAALYLIPAGALALLSRAWFARRLVLGALGFTIGVGPLLAYNYLATGNPLRPTQAMEVDAVMSRAPITPDASATGWSTPFVAMAIAADPPPTPPALEPRPGTRSPTATPALVQGGGLRISHLAKTLPANLVVLRDALGDLGLALGFVGALAALRSPPLFLLTVPYVVVSVAFFSLWTMPGPRYLAGVFLLLPLLVLEGARVLATLPAMLAARGMRRGAVAAASIVVVCMALAVERTKFTLPNALPWVELVLTGCVALVALAGLWTGERRARRLAAAALGVGLTVVLVWRSTATLGARASFQRPQVERARAVVEEAFEEPAVVLTTTNIGRPAENLNYYTRVRAVYLEEMTRWRMQPRYVLTRLLRSGYAVYLLLPSDYAKVWLSNTNISTWYSSEVVRAIPAAQAMDYFVASPYHRGIDLWLVRMTFKPRSQR